MNPTQNPFLEPVEKFMADFDFTKKWQTIKPYLLPLFEGDKLYPNQANPKSLSGALHDDIFTKRFIAKLITQISFAKKIKVYQPRDGFEQNLDLLGATFVRKCKIWGGLTSFSMSDAPALICGGNFAAIICLEEDTDDVEVYLWDLALCTA